MPRALTASAVAVIVVSALLAPVELPDNVDGVGRVLPAQEWTLARTPDGAITATLRDYRTGAVETTFAAEPERGDAVRFELGPAASQRTVDVGDPVGTFTSSLAGERLAQLAGVRDEAAAELRRLSAGAKAPDVEAERQETARAEAELTRARAAAERARLAAARNADLLDRGLLSVQDAEAGIAEARRAEAAVEAAQALVSAAQARVSSVQTGATPEALGVPQARLAAADREAAAVRSRLGNGTLRVPISGRVERVFSPDTLLLVSDTTAYHLLVPVRWEDRQRVQIGADVRLTGAGGASARIVDLRTTAAPAQGQAFSWPQLRLLRGQVAWRLACSSVFASMPAAGPHSSACKTAGPTLQSGSVRSELKYLLRETDIERFRDAIAPFVRSDAHAAQADGVPRYTVRSMYYDTPQLRDYAEKESGIIDRRKVRVRVYDSPGSGPVFLEVKRKQESAVWKDRAAVSPEVAQSILEGASLDIVSEHERLAAERFVFRLRGERRRPVLLVTYDREPYVGRLDPSLRITFDRGLRCSPFARPSLDDSGLYTEDLQPTLPGRLIVEVKFDRTFPSWMRPLVGSFGLRRQALSKYGMGLEDGARRRPWRFGPSAVRALSARPH